MVQPTENLTALTESNVFPPPEIVTYETDKSSKIENDKNSDDNKTRPKSALTLKLQEKMEEILNALPKSEFLTPKQFELINNKLDSIINIYNSVKVKTKPKRLTSKKQNNTRHKQPENSEGNVERIVAVQENAIQPNVQQSQIYAYLCNFN